MTIIETKRHPLKFYMLLTFLSIFLLGMGTLLCYTGLTKDFSKTTGKSNIPLIVAGVLFCSFAIWTIYVYFKNSPKVVITKTEIKIGHKRFPISFIKDVALTGKLPFKLIIPYPMEGTALLLNDDTEIFLYDDMYSNSHEIKSFLESEILKKGNQNKPILKTKFKKQDLDHSEIFKGNQFFSFRGIMLWGMIIFSGFIILLKNNIISITFLINFAVISTIWILINSWFMHYFMLTKNHLVIKNHNYLWVEKAFQLSNIKEIVFEAKHKQPNTMRIITNDFKNKIYPAGTLRDKTWFELKRKLEQRNIIVRNECIYE